MKIKYLARIYRHEGDFSAEVPDLPGCVAGKPSITLHPKIVRSIMMQAQLEAEDMR